MVRICKDDIQNHWSRSRCLGVRFCMWVLFDKHFARSPFPQQTIKVECTPGCPHQKRWSGQGGQIWSRDGLRGEGGNEMLVVSCCFAGLCIASKSSDMTINATLETQRSPNAAVWLLNLSIFRKSPKTTRPCAHGENSNTFICVMAKTGAGWVGAGKSWAKTCWIFSLDFRWHLSFSSEHVEES